MKRTLLTLAALVAFVWPTFAEAAVPAPFTDSTEVDLLQLLPPPPAADSAVTKAELDALVQIQNSRTKAQSDRAVADDAEDVWRFADAVNNPSFTKEKLPVFTAFFDRIVATEPAVVDPAKDTWKRPRPYIADSRVNPLLKKKTSGAYPSGHTTVGTLMALVLADMVPELRGAVMARAAEYADNRMVAGMHYASDLDAGKRAATAILAVLQTKASFLKAFQAAQAEVRTVLGYK
jgi:acid phosphatase (class A)